MHVLFPCRQTFHISPGHASCITSPPTLPLPHSPLTHSLRSPSFRNICHQPMVMLRILVSLSSSRSTEFFPPWFLSLSHFKKCSSFRRLSATCKESYMIAAAARGKPPKSHNMKTEFFPPNIKIGTLMIW